MATETIGTVRCGRTGRSCEVAWNPSNGEVFVAYAGWTRVGTATSAAAAMRKAQAFLFDK